jgi:hypothetical protein
LNRDSERIPGACGGVCERTENRFFILTVKISRGLPRGGFNQQLWVCGSTKRPYSSTVDVDPTVPAMDAAAATRAAADPLFFPLSPALSVNQVLSLTPSIK